MITLDSVNNSQMYLLNKCGGQKGRKDRNDLMKNVQIMRLKVIKLYQKD